MECVVKDSRVRKFKGKMVHEHLIENTPNKKNSHFNGWLEESKLEFMTTAATDEMIVENPAAETASAGVEEPLIEVGFRVQFMHLISKIIC